jgi:methyl-accepting chemotaxis protein
MKRFGLTTRLLLPGLIGAIAYVGVLVFVQQQGHSYARFTKQEGTRNLVESAVSVVAQYGAAEEKGVMSRADAQAAALTALKGMRYGSGGYFWVNDMHPRMIMHPTNPALNGKDLSDYRDPDGVALFIRMADACRAAGSGVIYYSWPKPGSTKPVPKVSFVSLYPKWSWIVGSGVYIDDIDAEIAALARKSLATMAVISLAVGLFVLLMARATSTPLRRIATQLFGASRQLQHAARQVYDTSQNIAGGAAEQARHVGEINQSMRDLAGAVAQSSADAIASDGLMGEVRETVEDGRRHMKRMATAMEEIATSNPQVSSIAHAIDEIAFQTNLLALNAAVEAARAGSAGVGFAVVADEVRKLAQRASEEARRSGEEIEQALQKTDEGGAIAGGMMQTFEVLTAKIRAVTGKSAQIAATAAAESERVAELRNAFERVTSIANANATGSQQTAAIAGQLQLQATTLDDLIHPLVAIVRGEAAARDSHNL